MKSGYTCPKCGSTDYYFATITVSKQFGSYGAISPDKGVFFNRPVSSSSEETVKKCKKCDTQLGEKDYYEHYTDAELVALEQAKVQDGADQRVGCYILVGLVVIAVIIVGFLTRGFGGLIG